MELGRRGEDAAAEYLSRRGYTILARNFRCRLGELDIVARDGRTLVFVEVRTRLSDKFGLPEESVDTRKKARLQRLALYYLHKYGLGEATCRFDVVAVSANHRGEINRVDLYADAF